VAGLGLLKVVTRFAGEKTTHQVRARCLWTGEEVTGYEIHHGVTSPLAGASPAFEIVERSGRAAGVPDGAWDLEGRVWGSNIHGLFENPQFRRRFLENLWEARGVPRPVSPDPLWSLDREYDRWADLVRRHLDMDAVYRLLNGTAR
jgi:adenosylcobyric acid synthase